MFLKIAGAADDHSGMFIAGGKVIGDGSVDDGHAAFIAF